MKPRLKDIMETQVDNQSALILMNSQQNRYIPDTKLPSRLPNIFFRKGRNPQKLERNKQLIKLTQLLHKNSFQLLNLTLLNAVHMLQDMHSVHTVHDKELQEGWLKNQRLPKDNAFLYDSGQFNLKMSMVGFVPKNQPTAA